MKRKKNHERLGKSISTHKKGKSVYIHLIDDTTAAYSKKKCLTGKQNKCLTGKKKCLTDKKNKCLTSKKK